MFSLPGNSIVNGNNNGNCGGSCTNVKSGNSNGNDNTEGRNGRLSKRGFIEMQDLI